MIVSTVNIITTEKEDNLETSNFFLGYSMSIKQNKQTTEKVLVLQHPWRIIKNKSVHNLIAPIEGCRRTSWKLKTPRHSTGYTWVTIFKNQFCCSKPVFPNCPGTWYILFRLWHNLYFHQIISANITVLLPQWRKSFENYLLHVWYNNSSYICKCYFYFFIFVSIFHSHEFRF